MSSVEEAYYRVGHTHNEVDQRFFVLSSALSKQEKLECPEDSEWSNLGHWKQVWLRPNMFCIYIYIYTYYPKPCLCVNVWQIFYIYIFVWNIFTLYVGIYTYVSWKYEYIYIYTSLDKQTHVHICRYNIILVYQIVPGTRQGRSFERQ